MIQPKYNPKEALEKMKLNMKYDTSKTLNENKLMLEVIPALLAPVIGWISSAAGIGTLSTASLAGIGTWIYNVQGGGDAFSKTQTFFQGCSSLDAKLKPTQSKGDHRAAADSIYNAIQGVGTDEDAIKGAISSMETVADLCAMYKYYNKTYGDLYDDLDSDLDGESFRQYVWSAIAPVVDDAEEDLAKAKEGGSSDDGKKTRGGGSGSGGGYKSCTGTYKKGCISDAIKKVQGCLGGLTLDGKFGPNTEKELKSKFPQFATSFTDSDVDTICNKKIEVDPDIEDVDAEDPNQL